MKYLGVLLFSGLLTVTTAAAQETLRYAVFPAPPFMIVAEQNEQEVSGIDIEIVNEIAARMKLEVTFVHCAWARCLQLLENGDADLLSSVWKRPERENYLRYLDTPFLDNLPVTFYYHKERAVKVEHYEDLYLLKSIGVLRGAGYFERFDQDSQLKKVEVSFQDQLFPMLARDRIEAVAGYVPTENYRLVVEGYAGKIERVNYEYDNAEPVYMTISTKSPFLKRIDEFNRVNDTLAAEGVLRRIRDNYYQKFTPVFSR